MTEADTAKLLRKEAWQLTQCDDGALMVHTEGDIVCHSDPNHEVGDFADDVRFKLIAAAPDLLEALKQVLGWIDSWDPSFTQDEEWPETRHHVNASIAKAEGA